MLAKRGRGRGNPFGVRKERVWEPLKWRVDHEAVVLLHVAGKTNEEIADIHGKSTMWVSLVINCKQARVVIERIRANLPAGQLIERYQSILTKAAGRLEDYLNNDTIAANAPFSMVSVSMRAMEMIDQRLKAAQVNTVTERITERTLILATEQNVDRLLGAIEKSDLVSKLHRVGDGIDKETEPLKLIANG